MHVTDRSQPAPASTLTTSDAFHTPDTLPISTTLPTQTMLASLPAQVTHPNPVPPKGERATYNTQHSRIQKARRELAATVSKVETMAIFNEVTKARDDENMSADWESNTEGGQGKKATLVKGGKDLTSFGVPMTAKQIYKAKRTAERRFKQNKESSEAQKMMLFGDDSIRHEGEKMGVGQDTKEGGDGMTVDEELYARRQAGDIVTTVNGDVWNGGLMERDGLGFDQGKKGDDDDDDDDEMVL